MTQIKRNYDRAGDRYEAAIAKYCANATKMREASALREV